MPPPCTRRRPGCRWPWSRRTRSAARACTAGASRPSPSSRRRPSTATSPHAKDFGIDAGSPPVDFAVSQSRKQKIVEGLWKGLSGLIKSRKITTYEGIGSLGPERTVTVKGATAPRTTLQPTHVVLAAGSAPRTIPGFEVGGPIMTSDEVLMLDRIPSRLAVIGGGAIGCEFASTFADLGSKVTILEGLPKILPGLDGDVANVVVRAFKKRGIDIKTGVMVKGHTPNGEGGTTVHFGDGEDLEVDAVSSRSAGGPYADELGLTGTAVVVDDRGFVVVDEYCRTAEPGVYAVGDLVDTPQLAHVGYAEAIVAVKDILGEQPVPVMYDRVPWAIYCFPEVAWSGHSEESAKAAGLRHRRRQAPVPGQQPGADHRRDRRPGEGHRQEAGRRHARARCSASTWSGPGSPSSWARATWPSTGRRPWPRWPSSSSPTRASPSCSGRRCSRSPEGA